MTQTASKLMIFTLAYVYFQPQCFQYCTRTFFHYVPCTQPGPAWAMQFPHSKHASLATTYLLRSLPWTRDRRPALVVRVITRVPPLPSSGMRHAPVLRHPRRKMPMASANTAGFFSLTSAFFFSPFFSLARRIGFQPPPRDPQSWFPLLGFSAPPFFCHQQPATFFFGGEMAAT